MSQIVIMPQLGETVAEGKILAWFKSVGDEVKEGDNLFEVETDKVTIEVPGGRRRPARRDPRRRRRRREGRRRRRRGWRRRRRRRPKPADSVRPKRRRRARRSRRSSTPLRTFRSRQGAGRRARDAARAPAHRAKRARHRGGSPPRRANSGERSHRREGGARRARARPRRAQRRPPRRRSRAAPVSEGEVVTLNAMRLRTGERLAENWRNIPHVFQAIEVDFTALDRVRQRHKEAFQQGARLLADLSAVHRARDLPRDRSLSADQRPLRRQGADPVARHPSRRRRRSRSQRSRRSRRARRRRPDA